MDRMCGRYTLRISAKEMATVFDVLRALDDWNYPPRYNIAPTQLAPVVRLNTEGQRELALLRWGLIPSWAQDPKIGASMINARAETVVEKPSFRTAFKRRRCLIPADGYFEWQKLSEKDKQPHFIHLSEDRVFAFAGLWESWVSEDGSALQTYSIVTTAAEKRMRHLHDRQPLALRPDEYQPWLTDQEQATRLLQPATPVAMEFFPVDKLVGNAKNDVRACVARARQTRLFE